VEDADQRAVLVEMGCHQGQGWHFSKPVEPNEMEALLRLSATLPQSLIS
jgi:EAL domain-containing protein (putative c-di-GMP-specific phosphodiesterase class I)